MVRTVIEANNQILPFYFLSIFIFYPSLILVQIIVFSLLHMEKDWVLI